MRPTSLLVFLAAACPLAAQSIVVPNANATTSTGLLLNNMVRESAMPRTYMQGIAAAELTGLPIGSVITGISARNGHTASNSTYPPTDATWANYDVTIGAAVPLASWTTTFAANFSGTPTKARSGAMVIESGSFVFTPAISVPQVHPWSTFHWDFQTPFVYLGGDLAILYTHPGSQSTSSIWLDAVTQGGNAVAYATTSYQGVSGAATNFVVVRIHYGYGGGCPGTGGKVPNLVLTNDVASGGSATFAGANALPSAPAAFVLGVNPLALPLPGGCSLLNDALVTAPMSLSIYGRARLTGTFAPGVAGVIYGQLFLLDAGAPSGFVSSLGAKLTVSP